MMKKTTDLRATFDDKLKLTLLNESKIVCCIDNNQKGNNLKYQQYGSSNNYIKVTGSVIIKYKYCEEPVKAIEAFAAVTFVNQDIPSPYLFPHFDKLNMSPDGTIIAMDLFKVITDLTQSKQKDRTCCIYPTVDNETVDVTGNRVRLYFDIIKIVQLMNLLRKTASGCYVLNTNKFKFVKYSKDEWMSNNRLKLFLIYIHNLKNSLLNMKSDLFQYKTVQQWNKHVSSVMKVIVPRVFLYDEITTDGYGKCIIELMTKHGILNKVKVSKDAHQWVLSNNWNEKTMIVCLDGLI